MKNWLVAGAAALTMGMTATASYAQTTTVPGEQVGLATGAPLPEGIYALNTFVYRQTPDLPTLGQGGFPVDVGVNIPVLVWSTPVVLAGGRLELLVAPPTVFGFGKSRGPLPNTRDFSVSVGTFVGGILAFDLGNNFGVSVLGGAYLNRLDGDRGVLVQNGTGVTVAPALRQLASNTYRFGVAGSYTGDGWNITANLTANMYDSPSTFAGNNFAGTRGPFVLSDSLNLDLTATKKFGKFEIGPIAYGTYNFDVSAASAANVNLGGVGRGRFAVGGLIGYAFDRATVQVYAARDVVTAAGNRAENTEVWGRIIVPLYTPTAAVAPAPAPLVRKY